MAEEKILIPHYKRTGICERCGADIYAPDLKQGSNWPLMSACVCADGPKLASKAEESRRAASAKLEEQAQAA